MKKEIELNDNNKNIIMQNMENPSDNNNESLIT